MSRIMKRNSHAMQRQGRNKGPEAIGQVADNTIHERAGTLVHALVDATVKEQSSGATNKLVELADGAEYPEQAALRKQLGSVADKWAQEPQMVELDTSPQLTGGPARLQLTSGNDGILDAEVG